MIQSEPHFLPTLPQKYRTQTYAALALVVMITYTVQLMLGIAEYSRLQGDERLSALPMTGFHIQNTSLAYRN